MSVELEVEIRSRSSQQDFKDQRSLGSQQFFHPEASPVFHVCHCGLFKSILNINVGLLVLSIKCLTFMWFHVAAKSLCKTRLL